MWRSCLSSGGQLRYSVTAETVFLTSRARIQLLDQDPVPSMDHHFSIPWGLDLRGRETNHRVARHYSWKGPWDQVQQGGLQGAAVVPPLVEVQLHAYVLLYIWRNQ